MTRRSSILAIRTALPFAPDHPQGRPLLQHGGWARQGRSWGVNGEIADPSFHVADGSAFTDDPAHLTARRPGSGDFQKLSRGYDGDTLKYF